MVSLIHSLFQKELKMSTESKIKSDYIFEEKTNDESDNFFNEILFQKYNLNEISFKGIGNFKIDLWL